MMASANRTSRRSGLESRFAVAVPTVPAKQTQSSKGTQRKAQLVFEYSASPDSCVVPGLQDLASGANDRTAFFLVERREAGHPLLSLLVVGQARCLAPAPRRMLGARTAAEDMHVDAAVILRALRALGRRCVVQRPIAGLEVVHAAALELRQHVDHRAADGADEEAPVRELDRGELALLPDVARRIDDQVAAVRAVEEHALRQHHRAAGTLVDDAGHHCGCSLASFAIRPKISIDSWYFRRSSSGVLDIATDPALAKRSRRSALSTARAMPRLRICTCCAFIPAGPMMLRQAGMS